jgi:nucleoside-diphosphate-sugar epimerase
MNVVVTGAAGFLGRRIVASLIRAGGCEIRALVRRPGQGVSTVRELAEASGRTIDIKAVNLLDRSALAGLLRGVDVVIHSAAGKKGPPADMFLNSVVATRNLMEACRESNVRRVVLVSSFSVYDTSNLCTGAVLDEAAPLEVPGTAKGPYGYAKAAQERLAQTLATQYGIELTIARPGVIFGPGDQSLSPRVGLRIGGVMVSLGGGAQLPLTYVDNCAEAIVHLGLTAPPGSIVNVVDDDLPTCSAFLRRYRAAVAPMRVVRLPYPFLLHGSRLLVAYHKRSRGQLPAVFTPHVVRSMYRPLRYSNQALKALGWKPRVSMDSAIVETMNALRSNVTRGAGE